MVCTRTSGPNDAAWIKPAATTATQTATFMSASSSVTERVLQFHEQLVRVEPPAIGDVHEVVVVDDEQIPGGPERPLQPRVHSYRAAVGVVLHETAQREVRRDIQPDTGANERGDET